MLPQSKITVEPKNKDGAIVADDGCMANPEESTPLLPPAKQEQRPGGDSNNQSNVQPKISKDIEIGTSRKISKWGAVHKKLDRGSFLLGNKGGLLGDEQTVESSAPIADEFDFHHLTKFSRRECLFVIAGYLLLGVIAYSYIFEDWPIIDSVYFSVVTFTTVGYGDIYPETDAGRLFTSFYVFTSIAFVSIALGALTEELVAMSVTADKAHEEEAKSEVMSLFSSQDGSVDEPIAPRVAESKSQKELSSIEILVYAGIIGFICLGGFLIGDLMGWDLAQIIYYTTITMTTVGYGEFAPTDNTAKLFSIVFIPVSVGCVGYLLGQITVSMTESRIHAAKEKLLYRKVTLDDLRKMDTDQSGQVTELEFLLFMLLKMGQVDKSLVDELQKQFAALDATGEGTLDRHDLIEHARKKLKTDVRTKLDLATYKKKLVEKSHLPSAV